MAIGKSYPKDNKIQDADLFLGTKASNLSTVNYTAQSVADYLNTKGKISIGGQMVFQFVIVNPSVGTISLPGEGGDGSTFSSITNLIVSINDMSSQNVVNFIDYIVGSEILLTEQNAISVFGNYKITDYTITSNPGFYNLTLEYIGGYGNINKDLFYDLTFFRDTGSSTSSNLQEVTDNGNITTNDMIVDSVNYFSTLSPSELSTLTKYGETGTYISANGEVGIKTGIGTGIIKTTNLLDDLTLEFPNKTGVKTIATTDDIVNVTPSALTKVDDTNVTLTLGGTPATSLLQAVSLTLGWTGTLADSRITSAATWNAKQNALSGTGVVKSTAGTISYINGSASEYIAGDGSLVTFPTIPGGTVTGVTATSPITSSGGATPNISTSMATNKLIGRSTAGIGVMEEITVGAGLSLSGGTLNATAQSVGFEQNFLLMGA
jgi:hypothetical protein